MNAEASTKRSSTVKVEPMSIHIGAEISGVELSQALSEAELSTVRVRDLKHTFGRRLRASGVSFEDRQDLLSHRSGRITTHYSGAELSRLVEAANKVCERSEGRPELVVLRRLSVS